MTVYTYSEAARIMETARDPYKGKPLQNNTRMYPRGFGETVEYAIQLHTTDVVTILKPRNGMGTLYRLSTGGWQTVTTRDRLITYAPVSRTLGSHRERGWELRLRPDPNDPEPDCGQRTIPKPFKVCDPGPEPVKSPEGCIAGTLDEFEAQEDDMMFTAGGEPEPWEFTFTRPCSYRSEPYVYVRRATNAGIYYGERSWGDEGWEALTGHSWGYAYSHATVDGREISFKQCPHCRAFGKLHDAWDRAMNGTGYGRNSGHGYRQMRECLDEFGSYEAWGAAYIEDFRRVREQRKAWNAWDARNHIGFFSGIIVDGDGYPLKGQVEQGRKAQRRYERERRRYERERERSVREEQRKRRFIERAKRARRDPFVVAAENIVVNARSIGVHADDSLEESNA